MSDFSPVRAVDGYLPIEDHGLIGDGATAALVGRDGTIAWLCAPRFDSPPLFCSILDTNRGGAFEIAPEGLEESRQFYAGDSGVLVTELRAGRALVPGDVARWRREAERIRTAIIEEAWDPQRSALTEHLGGGGLDASLLTLPLRRVIAADHPRMIATTHAVRQRLGAGQHGLLYRYLPKESPDGLPGHEGAFLLCSFWLVDNLAAQGRVEEAVDLFESLCARANPLGLLPEQIDPTTGAFLGNFPQAFSHVGLIASGVNLVRALDQRR